jgi:hypothetical protein
MELGCCRAEHRRPGPRDEQQGVKGGDGDGDNLPDLDAAKDDTQVGADAEAEVHLIDLPRVEHDMVVDQPQHRGDDDRRQHQQRGVVNNGVRNSSVTITASDMTTFNMAALHPAL